MHNYQFTGKLSSCFSTITLYTRRNVVTKGECGEPKILYPAVIPSQTTVSSKLLRRIRKCREPSSHEQGLHWRESPDNHRSGEALPGAWGEGEEQGWYAREEWAMVVRQKGWCVVAYAQQHRHCGNVKNEGEQNGESRWKTEWASWSPYSYLVKGYSSKSGSVGGGKGGI